MSECIKIISKYTSGSPPKQQYWYVDVSHNFEDVEIPVYSKMGNSIIGLTLKELIAKHGKRQTVGELIEAEMKADLEKIINEVRKEKGDANKS